MPEAPRGCSWGYFPEVSASPAALHSSADRVAANLVVLEGKACPWILQGRSHFLHCPKFLDRKGPSTPLEASLPKMVPP